MDTFWKNTLWSQLGASMDALENALLACPEEVLGDPSKRPESWYEFWYLVYHTLFWLDLYLHGSKEGFTPPKPFGLEELDPAGLFPEQVYSKSELQAYLQHCRRKAQTTLESLTDESARRICTFGWGAVSFAELLLYNLRHVQHHVGQLNLILRQKIDDAPRWVVRAGR
ncbi:MAG TPA: DinB family protein [Meiothermus sp.]|nr:DinB family protein [Meiothermus sp.]